MQFPHPWRISHQELREHMCMGKLRRPVIRVAMQSNAFDLFLPLFVSHEHLEVSGIVALLCRTLRNSVWREQASGAQVGSQGTSELQLGAEGAQTSELSVLRPNSHVCSFLQ